MNRGTLLRWVVLAFAGVASISCAHPDYQTRVTNVGQGGSGIVVSRLPIDKPPVAAVTPVPPGDSAVHETGVRKAATDWMTALKENSPSALSALTEDRFVLVSPDGATLGKDDLVALVRDGRLVLKSETILDSSVTEYGNAAFMTGTLKVQGTRDGGDISGSYRFVDTWIWQSGSWRKAAGVFVNIKE